MGFSCLLSHRAVLLLIYRHQVRVGSMWTAKVQELHNIFSDAVCHRIYNKRRYTHIHIVFMGPLGHAGWARVLTDLKLENGTDLL